MTFCEVALSEIARPISRSIAVNPGTAYRTLGVKWWGEGVYERATIDGSQTAARTLSVVRENDLIINKIWVRHGSTAIVPAAIDGCCASGEFPTFELDQSRVLPQWLHWQTKTQDFWNKCDHLSRGTSGKNRIRPELFLTITIPLPPLAEQRRIVARITALAAQINEARGLRREAVEEVERLVVSEELRLWPAESLNDAPSLNEITTFLSRGRQSQQGESSHYLIKTQHVQMGHYVPTVMKLASEVAVKVSPDAIARDKDILIACSAAGCLGRVALFKDTGRVESTDTHIAIARPDTHKVLPQYLYAYLKGGQGQIQLRSREKGDWQREKVGFRLTELNVADMRRVPVPLPPLPEQRRIVAYLDALQTKVDDLKALQAETAAELDALLPAVLDRAFKDEL